MMRFMKLSLVLVLAALIYCSPPVHAQTLGTITGVVSDSSGAVMAGVTVTATNEATNISRQIITDSMGRYNIPALQPSLYTVSAEIKGFKKSVSLKVSLEVNQTLRQDFTLEVGEMTETVDVTATAPLLQSESSTVGTVVENKQVVEMPLNGRSFTELTVLIPGAVPTGGATFQTGGGTRVSVSGASPDDNNYSLDGVNNNETFFKAYAIQPSVDAIQEFKIQTNITNAEFGNAAGANINVATKSGSNTFHGTAWEFLRNDVLDAKNADALEKSKFRQNQFGAVINGPVIKNKTFFMFDYEGFRFRRGAVNYGIVPTAAQLGGDLSHDYKGNPAPQIFDPATTRPDPNDPTKLIRDPFLNNIIPSNRIDPAMAAYAKVFYGPSAPNLPGQDQNLVNTGAGFNDSNQYHVRVDHKLTEKDTIYSRLSWVNTGNGGPNTLLGSSSATNNIFRNYMGNWTRLINANTIFEFKFSYHKNDLHSITYCPGGYDSVAAWLSEFGIQGIPASKDPNLPTWPQFSMPEFSSPSQDGYPFIDETYQFVGNLSITKGKHFFKMGFDYQRRTNYDDGLFSANESFTKDPSQDPQNLNATGQSLAAYLLGLPNNAARSIGATAAQMIWHGYYPYFQDDIKLTSKLTLNLGLRYDYTEWPKQQDGKMGSFDIYTGEWVWTATNPITGQPPNRENGLINPDRNNFAPRAGMAYMINNKTTIRAGYGMFYNTNFLWEAQGTRGDWPFAIAETLTPLNTTYPTSPLKTTFNQYLEVQPGTPVPPSAQHIHDRQRRVGYTQQWNVTMQRELTRGMVLEVGYVGTKSSKRSLFANTNTAPPGPGDPRLRMKYPELGPVSIMTDIGKGQYHGLQAKLEKRFSAGLSFTANYTWSKNMTTAGNGFYNSSSPQNPDKPMDDWGPSYLSHDHIFNINWVYEMPFGKGKRYLGGMNGIGEAVLGGWQVTGIMTAYSGSHIGVYVPRDTANIGARSANQRPDNTGTNPNLSNPTVDRWFDTSAFVMPAPYTFGNAGNGIITGPHSTNWNVGLAKYFRITERHRIQFRAEAFNIWNEVVKGNPDTNIESPNFGKIFGVGAARQLQFGLKYMF